MAYGFDKTNRNIFAYWFAHWCAFQMVALNLHIWKPKYLLHDIEKPWLMLLWKDYDRVHQWHRNHNKHHIEYSFYHNSYDMDIDAMIIDNECSRFTKIEAPLTAIEYLKVKLTSISLEHKNPHCGPYVHYQSDEIYKKALKRAYALGLTK